MPVTVRGTDILFNDGTTQSTAAGGAPAFAAVGSYMYLASSSTTGQVANSTSSGANLFYISATPGWGGSTNPPTSQPAQGDRRNASGSFSALNPQVGGSASTYTNLSGTWRFLGFFRTATVYDAYANVTWMTTGLYLRIA